MKLGGEERDGEVEWWGPQGCGLLSRGLLEKVGEVLIVELEVRLDYLGRGVWGDGVGRVCGCRC